MQICKIRVPSAGDQERTCVGATGKVEDTTPGALGGRTERREEETRGGAAGEGGVGRRAQGAVKGGEGKRGAPFRS